MIQRIGLKTLLITIILMPVLLMAQGKKPEVLVFGNGIDAYTAAIQSAKSRLNTVWIYEAATLKEAVALPPGNIEGHQDLHSGIWADLLAAAMGAKESDDSLSSIALRPLNPQLILNAMEEEISEFPHLTIIRNTGLRSAKKSKRTWEVVLADRRKYKVRAVVDASENGLIAQLAGLKELKNSIEVADLSTINFSTEHGYFTPLMRTGVIAADAGDGQLYSIPLGQLIQQSSQGGQDKPMGQNIFFTRNTQIIRDLLTHSPEDLPLLAHTGQAAGAAASYVAFYRTSSEKIEVRPVQGELLQYGLRLIPFQDIALRNPNFAAIQRIGATGIFHAIADTDRRLCFAPDQPVLPGEIRPALNELYSRSQIWFAEQKNDQFRLADLLSLIKYISHRGNELDTQVERNWERKFKFDGIYDPELQVTRLHVAVLLDEYCKPFDVRIDLQGRVTR